MQPDQIEIHPRIEVQLPLFSGPLQLLVALAEREMLSIEDLSLGDLTDEYLARLADLPSLPCEELAEFIWLATRLMLLKSLRLLPRVPVEEPEMELLAWEQEVTVRLREYRAYKEVAAHLAQRQEFHVLAVPAPPRTVDADLPDAEISLGDLLQALHSILRQLPPTTLELAVEGHTVVEKIELLRRLCAETKLDFVQLLRSCADRLEAVVTFVAMLELLHRGEIRVLQQRNFGAIELVLRR